MKVVTERDQIATVAARWMNAYYSQGKWGGFGGDAQRIYLALHALPSTATPADVARIIGNTGWIGETCSECDTRAMAFVHVGEEPDYESRTAYLCFDCAGKLAALVLSSAATTLRVDRAPVSQVED